MTQLEKPYFASPETAIWEAEHAKAYYWCIILIIRRLLMVLVKNHWKSLARLAIKQILQLIWCIFTHLGNGVIASVQVIIKGKRHCCY